MSKHKDMMEKDMMARDMAEHDMMQDHCMSAEMAGHKEKEMGGDMQPDDGNMMSQQMGEHEMSYHGDK